ncbi:MAG: FadR family transcriptional regulator [Aquitalea sp.]|nr:FadR family transcriptional regulator [Aquitalea sp.]
MEKTTLSAQVCNYLLNFIDKRQLIPGMEVPSEMQLIDTLGVSRGVIREAFRSLSTLGILEISSGKRPRVDTCKPAAMETIFRNAMATQQISAQQILDVRCALEMGCAEQAAQCGSAEDFFTLRQQMKMLRHVFGDHEQFIIQDSLFHLQIAKASGNPLYSLMIEALRTPLANSISAGLDARDASPGYESIIQLHQHIVDAICDRDPAAAKLAVARHFASATQALQDAAFRSGTAPQN